ncbi:MAG: S-layer homology domain-containing protein [Caldiserica bacterium]|nr:S-layer homology domain-containing protein [Caldisericota bacterium]
MRKMEKITIVLLTFLFISGGVNAAPVAPPGGTLYFQVFPEKQSYAPGEKVVLHLVLENPGKTPLTLQFSTSQVYDIQITGPGSYFWRWSKGRMFAQVITTITLEPGEKKEFQETWETEPSLSPGEYEVLAWLVSPNLEVQASTQVNLGEGSTGKAVALISDPEGCMILVRVPDSSRLLALKTMLQENRVLWVGGKVEADRFANPPWHFRFDPETLEVAEVTAEGLQAVYLRTIDSELDYWMRISPAYIQGKVVAIYETPPFNDAGENWAYPVILMLYAKGIINGFPDGNFYPERTLTRAEFVKMLLLALHPAIPMVRILNPTFSDVPFSHWASDFVENAVLLGWIKGFPDGTFRPDDPLTKEQILTILARAAGWTKDGYEQSLPQSPTFPDIPKAHWAFPYVEIAVEKGLIGLGDPHLTDGTFGVGFPALRNQTCLLLVRYLFFQK